MEIKQYQIIIVNLDPTVGSEIRKTRPCVVISPNEMNKHLRTITIAPVTSKSKDYMTRVKFELEGNDNWIVISSMPAPCFLPALSMLSPCLLYTSDAADE